MPGARKKDLLERKQAGFRLEASSQHSVPSTPHRLFYKPSLCQIVLAGPAWFSV